MLEFRGIAIDDPDARMELSEYSTLRISDRSTSPATAH